MHDRSEQIIRPGALTILLAQGFPASAFLHDMGDPVGAARHVRQSLAANGTWMIVGPAAGDRLEDTSTQSDARSEAGIHEKWAVRAASRQVVGDHCSRT